MNNTFQYIEKHLDFEYHDDMKIGRADNAGKQHTVAYFYNN